MVLASPDGWVFSLYEWQEAITAVPRWQLEEYSFGVEQDGCLLAVVPLHHVPSLRQLHSSGFGGSGPVLGANLGHKQRARVLAAIRDHISELALKLDAERLHISLSPVTRRSLSNRWGVNPLVLEGFDDRSSHTKVVDLSLSEDRLWSDLSASARQSIRKAQSSGYTARRCEWQVMLDAYYETHCENYRRTQVDPHPREYFEGIASLVAPLGHSVLWVGFSPENLPVAFHNSARLGPGGMYHTGCSRTAHLASGVNYLLMWESLIDAKREGLGYYEVGEIFPRASAGKEFGLSTMKSKFGGDIHRTFRGEFLFDLPQESDAQAAARDAESASGRSGSTGAGTSGSAGGSTRAGLFRAKLALVASKIWRLLKSLIAGKGRLPKVEHR